MTSDFLPLFSHVTKSYLKRHSGFLDQLSLLEASLASPTWKILQQKLTKHAASPLTKKDFPAMKNQLSSSQPTSEKTRAAATSDWRTSWDFSPRLGHSRRQMAAWKQTRAEAETRNCALHHLLRCCRPAVLFRPSRNCLWAVFVFHRLAKPPLPVRSLSADLQRGKDPPGGPGCHLWV